MLFMPIAVDARPGEIARSVMLIKLRFHKQRSPITFVSLNNQTLTENMRINKFSKKNQTINMIFCIFSVFILYNKTKCTILSFDFYIKVVQSYNKNPSLIFSVPKFYN